MRFVFIAIICALQASNCFSHDVKTAPTRIRRVIADLVYKKWSEGVIPFMYDTKFFSENDWPLFERAMRHWEKSTCIQFIERDPSQHPDYIVFTSESCGCCTLLAHMQDGSVHVSIGYGCYNFRTILHELGHAIGYWHEHMRPDRDQWVMIKKENIISGRGNNFEKLPQDRGQTFGMTYDYESIMHYRSNTFSKNNLDTIVPIDATQRDRIGEILRISEGDIAATNRYYQCPECGGTLQEIEGSLRLPTNITKPITCTWRITAPRGRRIILDITLLSVEKCKECWWDYIMIKDGYWSKSPLVFSHYYGEKDIKKQLVSTGNRMLVTYLSYAPSYDNKPAHRFEANYTILPN